MAKEQICIRGGLDDSFLIEKENMAKVRKSVDNYKYVCKYL